MSSYGIRYSGLLLTNVAAMVMDHALARGNLSPAEWAAIRVLDALQEAADHGLDAPAAMQALYKEAKGNK